MNTSSRDVALCSDHEWAGRGECPGCREAWQGLTPEPEAPKPGSAWRHRNGAVYEVLMITNCESTRDEYPPTVVYRGIGNGKLWSRRLDDWHRSMTLVSTGAPRYK